MIDFALKRVSPDVVEGLAIPYGVDTDGEQFTPDTDLCLDWFPGGKSGRPVLYDHGLEAPGPSVIGRQTEYEERAGRPLGAGAAHQEPPVPQGRRPPRRRGRPRLLVGRDGAPRHLQQADPNAITRWPWVELSLTPIPAHPGAMVHAVKSADAFRHWRRRRST
jgi:hypothetical protein